jgi:hypothetical protein
MKIVTEEVAPVTKLRKSVPPNVAAALTTALEKLPADRFESARAFAEALASPGYATARNPTTLAQALYGWFPWGTGQYAEGIAVSSRSSTWSRRLPSGTATWPGTVPRAGLDRGRGGRHPRGPAGAGPRESGERGLLDGGLGRGGHPGPVGRHSRRPLRPAVAGPRSPAGPAGPAAPGAGRPRCCVRCDASRATSGCWSAWASRRICGDDGPAGRSHAIAAAGYWITTCPWGASSRG